jgi:hypothetical protein
MRLITVGMRLDFVGSLSYWRLALRVFFENFLNLYLGSCLRTIEDALTLCAKP